MIPQSVYLYKPYDRLLALLVTLSKRNDSCIKQTRPGIRAVTLFSRLLTFDLNGENIVPVPHRKKIYFNSIWGELKTFIEGKTTLADFSSNGCKFWEPWGTREFLDKAGLNEYPDGELGPIYGAQWIDFGRRSQAHRSALAAELLKKHPELNLSKENMESLLMSQESAESVNQLEKLVRDIIADPLGRRHIVTALHPGRLEQQALPPCHMMFQVGLDPVRNRMNMHVYMRSADVFVGVPYNIVSYATLLHLLVAELQFQGMTDVRPGELSFTLFDAHLYENLIPAAVEYLGRHANVEEVKIDLKNNSLLNLTEEKPVLINYHPQDAIEVSVAV